MPEHVIHFLNRVEPNVHPIPAAQQQAWERAPAHTVMHDECPGLNTGVMTEMSGSAGEDRTSERDLRAGELKLKYPEDWGRRGRPKAIASLENAAGNPITERTVQRYFKLPKN